MENQSTGMFSSIFTSNKQKLEQIKKYESAPIGTTPRNLVFVGMIGFTLILSIMFAAQIIQGVFALVLVLGTGVGGFFGLRFLKAMDPVIRQKTKNLKLSLMKEEAHKNAVHQLDNQVLVNAERLKKARSARDQTKALVGEMESKLNETDPNSSIYKNMKEMLDKVSTAYEIIAVNIDKGAQANKEFEKKVEEYKSMDRFAKLAAQAMGNLGGGADKLDEMLSLEAMGAIDTNFNSSMAMIENTARDMEIDGE